MFKRKLRKLMRDPKSFFADMAIKRRHSTDILKPKELSGNYQYTIVSAVYNVGRYLNEYIESVTKQHLDFKKHIHLILVDDGSTDNSAAIIKKWQNEYPENIQYLYKENGGQASARNMGMQYVKTDWVTFADPDDILDLSYFKHIDSFAHKQKDNDIVMLCNNFIFYFDDINTYKDSHPLKYRFSKGDVVHPVNNLGKNMQLAVNSAIFKSSIILNNKITFNDKIKPNFEDAHFIGSYLSGFDKGNVGFISKAKYYYRKRSDGTSTLDTSWEKKGLYNDVLVHGCLDMFSQYINTQGQVPKYIQRTVLYHLMWYFKRLVNNEQKLAFLTDDEKNRFKELLWELFENIDNETIMEFELAGCWFYHKVALLGLFKQTDPTFQIAYIESIDKIKGMIELRYFTKNIGLEAFNIDGLDVIPYYVKSINHKLLDNTFVIERRIWLPFTDKQQKNKGNLKVLISNIPTRISLGGKQYYKGVLYNQILAHFASQKPKYKIDKKYQNAWLLMDRDTHADDNAEHLYRYIKKNHPEQDIYFVLAASANDWQRLAAEEFNMLAFGSEEHEVALRSCSKLISSHIDKYISNYLGPKMMADRHFVFLQHGITKDDLSGWLNSKENIDCLITATPDEYNSFTEDGSAYKLTQKNIALTGFPRHDALLLGKKHEERLIVIMPTWRKTLVGNALKNGDERELNPDFITSEFAIHWLGVLNSPSLKSLTEKYNFKVAFYPHPLIEPFKALLNVPEYVEVMSNSTTSIQEVFSRASMMITDYSSVAFDMAILDKPIIYYQFDEQSFFNGGHSYTKGYYDYRKHGFGPVVTEQEELFFELENLLINDGRPSQEILNRIANTFPYRDGLCCERVYQAIIKLDAPLDSKININILSILAEQASLAKNWELAASRWEQYFELVGHEQTSLSQQEYLKESIFELTIRKQQALREQGRFIEARSVLISLSSVYDPSKQRTLLEQKSLLAYACRQWDKAIEYWHSLGATRDNDKYAIALAEAQHIERLKALLDYSDKSSNYEHALISIANRDWDNATLYLKNTLSEQLDLNSQVQTHLLLVKSYRHSGHYEEALIILKNIFENNTTINEYYYECFYERLIVNFITGKFKNCKEQLNTISDHIDQLPADILAIALDTYYQLKENDYAQSIIDKIEKDSARWKQCLPTIGNIYISLRKWDAAELIFEQLRDRKENVNSHLLKVYIEQGKIRKALELIDAFGFEPSNISEWSTCAELYSLVGRWNDAAKAWHYIIVNFRNSDITQHAWSNLRHAQMICELREKQL